MNFDAFVDVSTAQFFAQFARARFGRIQRTHEALGYAIGFHGFDGGVCCATLRCDALA